MKKLLLIASTLILLSPLLVAAGIFIYFDEINLTPYKNLVSKQFKEYTGRQLNIGGELRLNLTSKPSLTTSRIQVANPDWAQEPVLFSADKLLLEFNLGTLLDGEIDHMQLNLTNARINAEVSNEGERSWWLFEQDKDVEDDDIEIEFDRHDLPSHIDVNITETVVNYSEAETGDSWSLSLDKANLSSPVPGEPVDTVISGTWNEKTLDLEGQVGPVDKQWNFPIQLSGKVLGINGSIDGSIPLAIAQSSNSQLKVKLNSDNLKPLRGVLGPSIPAIGPVAIEFTMTGQSNRIQITNIKGNVQRGRLTGGLTLTSGKNRPLLSGTLDLDTFNLTPWLPAPLRTVDNRKDGASPFSTRRLNLTPTRLFDAQLNFTGRDVTFPRRTVKNVSGTLRSKSGNVEVNIKSESVDKSNALTIHYSATRKKGGQSVRLKIHDEKMNWDDLFKGTGLLGSISGRVNIDLDLSGRGRTPAELLGSMDGRIILLMGKGKAQIGKLDRTIGGTNAILGQMFSKKANTATVNCMAVNMKLNDGIANLDMGAIDTQYSTIVAQGKVNLKNGSINLETRPRAKGVTLSVATPVSVSGSISKPVYTIKKGAILARITTLATNVLLPETLVLKLFGDAAAGNPCLKVTAKAPEKESKETDTKTKEETKSKRKSSLDIIDH